MKFANYEALENFYTNAEQKGYEVSDYLILKPSKLQIEKQIAQGKRKPEDEIDCIFDVQEKGMALLIDRFEKKYSQTLPIKIIGDDGKTLTLLEKVLTEFNQKPEGSKLTVIVRYLNHWTVIHCEKNQNINRIAVMDPLAFNVYNINIVDSIFEKNIDLKANSVLYKPIQNVQFDEINCGIFASKIAQKIAFDLSFFENLHSGEYILSQQEASDYIYRSKKWKNYFFDDQLKNNNKYFILPPQYFCLHQRQDYLEYYKNDFGSRKGVTLFKPKTKSGKSMTFEELYNREDRKQSLSVTEAHYYKKFSVTKHDILHFANKYNEGTIKNTLATEVAENLNQIHNKYLLTG